MSLCASKPLNGEPDHRQPPAKTALQALYHRTFALPFRDITTFAGPPFCFPSRVQLSFVQSTRHRHLQHSFGDHARSRQHHCGAPVRRRCQRGATLTRASAGTPARRARARAAERAAERAKARTAGVSKDRGRAGAGSHPGAPPEERSRACRKLALCRLSTAPQRAARRALRLPMS